MTDPSLPPRPATDPSDELVVAVVDDPSAPDVMALTEELTSELLARYGRGDGGAGFRPEQTRGRGVFVAARAGTELVGCGALISTDDPDLGEIKRMYVRPTARRRGAARRVLLALEAAAVEYGYASVRLETGPRQPEAIGLYESAGYRRVACWPPYADDPDSVCLAKRLGHDAVSTPP